MRTEEVGDGNQATARRFEFRLIWTAPEHRRFYRALQRIVRRGSKPILLLRIWFVVIVVVCIAGAAKAHNPANLAWQMVPIAMIVAWVAFDRWGLAYVSARAYRRDHAACVAEDQVRVVDDEGVEAHCKTSDAVVKWIGICAVHETAEFFLFMTSRNCAIQLPKRAIPDADALRAWVAARAPNTFAG